MTDLERYNKDKALVISIIKYLLIFAIGAAVIYGLTKFIVIMVPFLVGFLLAKTSHMISDPIVRGLGLEEPKDSKKNAKQKKPTAFQKFFGIDPNKPKKSPRVTAALIVYVILLIFVTIFCAWAVLALISQANNAVSAIAEIARGFSYDTFQLDVLDEFSSDNGGILSPEIINILKDNAYSIANNAIKFIPTLLTNAISFVWDIIGSLPTVLFIIICVILSGYYFISDGPTVTKLYFKNMPNKDFRRKSFTLINELSETLFKVLGGYIVLLALTAVEAGIVLFFADVKYILILALVTGAIDFLPVLGISATMLPVAVYCAINGNYKGVIIIIIGMAIMTVVRRIVEPLVLSKTMKLHPLVMLIAMVIGMYIWGAIGFLLGPTASIIILSVMKTFKLDKKATLFLSQVLKKFMSSPEEIEEK